MRRRDDDHADSKKDIWEAFAPYMIIIAVFSIAQIGADQGRRSTSADPGVRAGPGWTSCTPAGEASTSVTFKFNWAAAAGTLLLFSGLLTMLVLRVGPGRAVRVFGKTLDQLKLATITVGVGARAGVRDEPVRADADDRQLDRRRRRRARAVLLDHRLARASR